MILWIGDHKSAVFGLIIWSISIHFVVITFFPGSYPCNTLYLCWWEVASISWDSQAKHKLAQWEKRVLSQEGCSSPRAR